MRLKNIVRIIAVAAAVSSVAACDSLSEQEERMVGDYYMSAVSDNVPVYELGPDRTAKVRRVVGDMVIEATGRWRVKDDSLTVDVDPASLSITGGDPAVIDVKVPEHVAHHIISYNGITLSLRHADGLQYDYHRRYHQPEEE